MPSTLASPARPKLPSLTGLRFIAAALVFFFHASLIFISMNPFADDGVADGFRWLFSKASAGCSARPAGWASRSSSCSAGSC
ncbi:hypothetical protein [Streptomyces sp. WM6372]|uniref:hypothetical protein n=1 Tax=Streptomyces sp. WM6372 TaxID=1415555 RepID=UPI001F26A0B0|nr:hypothetical protein [Streptomyces sp. WM6372]